MNELADVLKRFNRKERNLLVRAVLGDEQKPLRLVETFRRNVAQELKIEMIAEAAWWATDYHITWLAGALAYYTEGDASLNKARLNRSSGPSPSMSRLIEGNQEDIDLIIASGLDLILIEAKAFGSWDNKQLRSKLDRLKLLHIEYQQIADRADRDRVRMHFLLTSPRESKNINVEWPEWIRKENQVPWIELHLPDSEAILEVNRCDADAEETAEGDHWRIVKY
jgi:hypothetical protein